MRLKSINYDQNQWKVTVEDGERKNENIAHFLNLKTKKKYQIKNLIGLEQVSPDEFLVCSYTDVEKKHKNLSRINFSVKVEVLFQHDFVDSFHFLNENIIFFDNDGLFYDISSNQLDDSFNHLITENSNIGDFCYYRERKIHFFYNTVDDEYPHSMLVDYLLPFEYIDTNEYVQLAIDVATMKPAKAFSTMQNAFYSLKEVSLSRIFQDDKVALQVFGSKMKEHYFKDCRKKLTDF